MLALAFSDGARGRYRNGLLACLVFSSLFHSGFAWAQSGASAPPNMASPSSDRQGPCHVTRSPTKNTSDDPSLSTWSLMCDAESIDLGSAESIDVSYNEKYRKYLVIKHSARDERYLTVKLGSNGAQSIVRDLHVSGEKQPVHQGGATVDRSGFEKDGIVRVWRSARI